jgi:hypothetical protein
MNGPIQLRRYTSVAAAASSTVGLVGQPFWVEMPGGEFRLYRHDGSSTVATLYASTNYLVPFDELQTLLDLKLDIADVDTDPTLASPSNSTVPSTLAIKTLVDDRLAGIDWKDSVRVRTTANITLSGTQTIDTVALSVDDRVLVMDQTATEENGLYLCKSGAWVRTADADTAEELEWATVTVTEGSTYGGTRWHCISSPITLGSTAVEWTDFGGGVYTADESTLTLSGAQFLMKDAGTTNAKLANMAQARIKGRAAAAGTGAPTDLTPDEVATILDAATDAFMRTSRDKRATLSADFTTSSATYVDVTGLAITLDANSTYLVSISGCYSSPATATGVGVSLTRTGSPTICNLDRTLYTAITTAVLYGNVGGSDDFGPIGTSVDTINVNRNFSFFGTVKTSGDPCVIQVRAARGGTSNTIAIKEGAVMMAHKIA